jgi:hypothetical protein
VGAASEGRGPTAKMAEKRSTLAASHEVHWTQNGKLLRYPKDHKFLIDIFSV